MHQPNCTCVSALQRMPVKPHLAPWAARATASVAYQLRNCASGALSAGVTLGNSALKVLQASQRDANGRSLLQACTPNVPSQLAGMSTLSSALFPDGSTSICCCPGNRTLKNSGPGCAILSLRFTFQPAPVLTADPKHHAGSALVSHPYRECTSPPSRLSELSTPQDN